MFTCNTLKHSYCLNPLNEHLNVYYSTSLQNKTKLFPDSPSFFPLPSSHLCTSAYQTLIDSNNLFHSFSHVSLHSPVLKHLAPLDCCRHKLVINDYFKEIVIIGNLYASLLFLFFLSSLHQEEMDECQVEYN